MLLVLSAGVSLYILLWSRSLIGSRKTAVLYAVGAIAQGFIQSAALTLDSWKSAFALPVAVCLLAATRTRGQSILALAALAGFSIFAHYRSFAGICVLIVLGVLLTSAEGLKTRKFDVRLLIILPVSVIVLQQLATVGLLNGWFGASMQAQAISQTQGGQRSILVGARPESAAALALFQSRPVGFGPGVVPNLGDVATAINALENLGINPNTDYVRVYLFGDRLNLHSLAADLWLMFGFPGLTLAAAILWYLLVGLLNNENRLAVGAVGMLVGMSALWAMAFSPLSSFGLVTLALALLLPARYPPDGNANGNPNGGLSQKAKVV